MGRGVVKANGGDGLYTIEVDAGSERAAERAAALEEEIAELDDCPEEDPPENCGGIAAKQSELDALEDSAISEQMDADVAAAVAAYDSAVRENCSPEGYEAASIQPQLAAVRQAYSVLWPLIETRDRLLNEIQALNTEIQKAEDEIEAQAEEEDLAKEAYDEVKRELDNTREALDEAIFWCDVVYAPELCDRQAIADLSVEVYIWELLANQRKIAWDALVDKREGLEADIEQWQADIEQAQIELDAVLPNMEAAQEDIDAAKAALDEQMKLLGDALKKCDAANFIEQLKALEAAVVRRSAYYQRVEEVKAELALLKARKASLEKKLERFEQLQVTLKWLASVWCVDLTDDIALETEVGTIEIPGDSSAINIRPGYTDPAPTAADGQLLSREVCTAAQAFFNCAVLPGWQRWMPMYRVGEIVDIDYDADTASVFLDDATSSAQGLDINQADWTLDDIPVEYMDCNASAFDVADRVVVEARPQPPVSPTTEAPAVSWRVIGFESNPKPCIILPDYFSGFEREQAFLNAPAEATAINCGTGPNLAFYNFRYFVVLPDGTRHVYYNPVGTVEYDDGRWLTVQVKTYQVVTNFSYADADLTGTPTGTYGCPFTGTLGQGSSPNIPGDWDVPASFTVLGYLYEQVPGTFRYNKTGVAP